MNYTEKYHLPQWAESDRILMTDFNQMCADIEAGITAAKAAADSAGTIASQAKATGDDLAPRVTAVENAVKFVKLGEVQASGAGSYPVSLSGIDLSGYSGLVIDGCYSGQSDVRVRMNNDSASHYYEQAGSPINLGCILGGGNGGNGHSLTHIHPCGTIIASKSHYEILTNTGLWDSSRLTFYTGCGWAALGSLVFEKTGSGSATLLLYGVKA